MLIAMVLRGKMSLCGKVSMLEEMPLDADRHRNGNKKIDQRLDKRNFFKGPLYLHLSFTIFDVFFCPKSGGPPYRFKPSRRIEADTGRSHRLAGTGPFLSVFVSF